MRVVAIKNSKSEAERLLIHEVHCLRAHIFRGRLTWDGRRRSDFETDRFDGLNPTYVLYLDYSDAVIGCARLTPAMGGMMLELVFPKLLGVEQLPYRKRMIESFQFYVDTKAATERAPAGLHSATAVRFERILRRAGWPSSRLGAPLRIDETRGVAYVLPANSHRFDRLRPSIYSSNFSIYQKDAA